MKYAEKQDESDSGDTSSDEDVESEVNEEVDEEVDEDEDDDLIQEKKATAGKMTGVIIRFLHDRGIGFIKSDVTGEDVCTDYIFAFHCFHEYLTTNIVQVFMHRESCEFGEYKFGVSPKQGAKVEFDVEKTDKGFSAQNVRAVGGGPCPSGRSKGTILKC